MFRLFEKLFIAGHTQMKEKSGEYFEGRSSLLTFIIGFYVPWFLILILAYVGYVLTLGGKLVTIEPTTQEKK